MNAIIKAIAAGAALAALSTGAADPSCAKQGSPPPSIGHDRERAGEPDPPAVPRESQRPRSIRFVVDAAIPVVVTFNSGHGNKFYENIVGHDDWMEASYSGARVYLGAVPARRDTKGRITIKIDYGTDNEIICFDTNFSNTHAGADCHGKVK